MVFSIWLGKDFADTPRTLFACYATYFVAHVWRHLNHAMMIGSGQVGRLARIQFAESALVVIAAIVGLRYGGMGTMLLSMAAVIFAVTGCILPRLVGHGLRVSARDHGPAMGAVAEIMASAIRRHVIAAWSGTIHDLRRPNEREP